MTPGDRREPPADTKCPPAAQRKQAKRACIYITHTVEPVYKGGTRQNGPLYTGNRYIQVIVLIPKKYQHSAVSCVLTRRVILTH